MNKILVVDDEGAIVNLLTERLKKDGFEVAAASDAKTAVKQAKKVKPDLVLMDVNLGKTDGFAALKELKEDKKLMSIPVFMLTGRGAEEDIRTGISNYADKYIVKPFEYTNLLAEIKKTLNT